jgi:hypothetical protein
MGGWCSDVSGVVRLPSGRLVRGRGLRRRALDSALPQFGVYLLNKPPAPTSWQARWVRWPDFWLPPPRHATRKTRCARRGVAPGASGWRLLVAAAGAGPVRPLPAWRCWTACPPRMPSPTCGSTTTGEPSRPPGSAATSTASRPAEERPLAEGLPRRPRGPRGRFVIMCHRRSPCEDHQDCPAEPRPRSDGRGYVVEMSSDPEIVRTLGAWLNRAASKSESQTPCAA